MNKRPVTLDGSTDVYTSMLPRQGQSIRITICCALTLLFICATPGTLQASPASSGLTPSTSTHAAAAPGDIDDDGIPDDMDPDDDADQVSDDLDEDPLEAGPPPSDTPGIIAPDQDTDNDGIENIMDPDDDNDAVEDDEDPAPFTPVPPSESVEEPEPEPSETPEAERSAPEQPIQPEVNDPAPLTVDDAPPAITAPVVVALPSTGGADQDRSRPAIATVLATLALVTGTGGGLARRRSYAPEAAG